MNAFVFQPTNGLIGKFPITTVDDIMTELPKFLAETSVPLNAYIVAGGWIWTITSLEPLTLETIKSSTGEPKFHHFRTLSPLQEQALAEGRQKRLNSLPPSTLNREQMKQMENKWYGHYEDAD